jgi:two-component system, NtrC family, sensor kinase
VIGALQVRYDMASDLSIHRAIRWRMLISVTAITLLLILGLRTALARLVVRPLKEFTSRAEAIAHGDLGARVPPQSTGELSVMERSFNAMASTLQASLDALESRRESLESEVRQRTAELTEAKVHLEKLNRALEEKVDERTSQLLHAESLSAVGTLASGVAHEINNPLATILTCADGLTRTLVHERASIPKAAGDKLENYLALIRDEAKRCRTITSQLLDFSRKRIGTMMRLDLREAIGEALVLAQPKAAAESKRLNLDLPDHPLPVRGEPGSIKQLLLNLVLNALDASPLGALVTVKGFELSGLVHIEVSDPGRGLTPDELSRAFEPFFTTKANGRGTGLGLTVCHMIVQQHDGRIRLQSDGPGRGALATVTLPLEQSGAGEAA